MAYIVLNMEIHFACLEPSSVSYCYKFKYSISTWEKNDLLKTIHDVNMWSRRTMFRMLRENWDRYKEKNSSKIFRTHHTIYLLQYTV